MNADFDRLLVLNFCGCSGEQFELIGELASVAVGMQASAINPVFNFFVATEKALFVSSPCYQKAKVFFLTSAEALSRLQVVVHDIKSLGLRVSCTPFDEDSLGICRELGCDFVRMPAGAADDWGLLEAVGCSCLPVILPRKSLSADSFHRVQLFLQNRNIPHVFTFDESSSAIEVSLWPVFCSPSIWNRDELLEQMERWFAAASVIFEGSNLCAASTFAKNAETCPEGEFARGVYSLKDLSAGELLSASNCCLGLVEKTDQLLAGELSKYSIFLLQSPAAKGSSISRSNVLEKRIQPDRITEIPAQLKKVSVQIAGVDCIHLQQKVSAAKKIILFVHGGGFVSGSPEYALATAVNFALRTSFEVLSIGYRLAPQYPCPAARNDVANVYGALLEAGYAGKDIAFWGESAGGGLVLSVVQALIGEGRSIPAAVACSSPWADLTNSGESHSAEKSRADIILKTSILNQNARDYAQGISLADPGVSPLFGEFDGFPPLLLLAGSREILLSDAVAVAEKVCQCNGSVDLRVYEGMPHVFTAMTGVFEQAAEAMAVVADFFRRRLCGEGTAK